MIEEKDLELEAVVHEAAWIGDPAVDLDLVDAAVFDAWRLDGEARHLPVRPKAKLSRIRWRGLDPRERDEAIRLSQYKPAPTDAEIDPHGYLALISEMARFGVVSFQGLALHRDHFHGVRGIDDDGMRKLVAVRLGKQEDGSPLPAQFPFLAWIGGLIAGATFREGR